MTTHTSNKSKHERIELLSQQANLATEENRLPEAYEALVELAELLDESQTNRAETLNLAGCVASALGKHTDATKWFSSACDLNPDNADTYHNLGLAHLRQGEVAHAIGTYEKALSRGVVSADMLHDLAVAHMKLGELVRAEERLTQALEIDGNHRLSQAGLLEMCRKSGNEQRAAELLEQWRAVDRDDAELIGWQEALNKGVLFGDAANSAIEIIADVSESVTELRNKNIAVVATSSSFLSDIKAHLTRNNTIKTFSAGSMTELQEILEWADVAWFDWCDHLLIQATGHLPKLCPIVCRLHSYEAFTEMPDQVEWSAVDEVVFVNESVRTLLGERLPKSLKTSVVSNAVDVDRYTITPNKKHGKRIASVGYINYKKNPQLLLYLFKMIHDWDPEFELHIAGEQQDPRLEVYMRDMARKMDLPIVYHGWVKDMPSFYADKDFVISTSLFESFHYSIAEGMACGLLPLVHDWFGSENIYPDEYRFITPEDGLALVKRLMKSDRSELGKNCREHICQRFALPMQLEAVDKSLVSALEVGRRLQDKNTDYGLVSIVVPTYNRADMLPEAISSALKQSYPHFEIIVVNDGSTDESRELLDSYAEQCPEKIRVIHQENKGVSAALNTAIRSARGEYISWLSSDDAYHQDKIWEDVRRLGDNPELGWVYSDFYYMTHDSQVTKRAHPEPLMNESFVEDMFDGNPIHGCSVMFRKSNLDTVGYFDEELGGKIGYGADGALWHKMGYHYKFEYIDKALVYYRLHPGQVTHQADIPAAMTEYESYMRSYFATVEEAASAKVESSIQIPGPRAGMRDSDQLLGIGADPDFPEEKVGGRRILWIGAADPCGNAAMYARAINRHTPDLCRVVTFKELRGFDHDIVIKRQGWAGGDDISNDLSSAEEGRLRDLAEKADQIVFSACSYAKMSLPDHRMDDTDHLIWDKLDWREYTKKKPCTAFFFGSTSTRHNADWYWDLYAKQKGWRIATGQLDLKRRWKDAHYVPTWLDIDAPRYQRIIEPSEKILVVQTPTDPPIKNSKELEMAVRQLMPDYPRLSLEIRTGLSYKQSLKLKRRGQMALDQMQINDGYYCMSSLENSALGLVNFVYVDDYGLQKISDTLETDEMPWQIVKSEDELRLGLQRFLDDPELLWETQRKTYDWMREYWHPSRLVGHLSSALFED